MSKTSESMKKAIRKYQTEKCDDIRFRTPKGKKEIYAKYAALSGLSMTKFIIAAIEEKAERDGLNK